jgi:hypothetical protein
VPGVCVVLESEPGCPDIVLLAGFFVLCLALDIVPLDELMLPELIVFDELVVLGELIVLPELGAAGCVAVVDVAVLSAAMAAPPSMLASAIAGTIIFKDGMLFSLQTPICPAKTGTLGRMLYGFQCD